MDSEKAPRSRSRKGDRSSSEFFIEATSTFIR